MVEPKNEIPLDAMQFKDPPELTAGKVPPMVGEGINAVMRVLPKVRSPLPQGLSDSDMIGVLERRSQVVQELAFARGMVEGMLLAAAGYGSITKDQFREQMTVLHTVLAQRPPE
jgi:hypothetical protein